MQREKRDLYLLLYRYKRAKKTWILLPRTGMPVRPGYFLLYPLLLSTGPSWRTQRASPSKTTDRQLDAQIPRYRFRPNGSVIAPMCERLPKVLRPTWLVWGFWMSAWLNGGKQDNDFFSFLTRRKPSQASGMQFDFEIIVKYKNMYFLYRQNVNFKEWNYKYTFRWWLGIFTIWSEDSRNRDLYKKCLKSVYGTQCTLFVTYSNSLHVKIFRYSLPPLYHYFSDYKN